MFQSSTNKISPQKRYPEEDAWEYIEERKLKRSYSSCVCMTCNYFDYSCDRHCRTLLICRIQERLIPHGDHLISRCPLWNKPIQPLKYDYPDAA
ncbi:galactose oxidase [Prochlorococcus marinus]|uniref:galactose oxidase n=1 Tax=Prochlorococcus marinus TaxID=1219 RepID=UPI0022B3EABC|nr:galactose oxidase [Prochlorococcus marinus]